MENNNDYLNNCLLELSGTLESLLSNPKENSKVLNHVENWIKTHYSRIQLTGAGKERIVVRNLDNQAAREDALFIFNSSFQIISYAGTQSFFSDAIKTRVNNNLNLLDIVEETDRPHLKSLLEQAIKNRENVKGSFHVKTNINILNTCIFELDMVSSNPTNDRFVGKLVFSEMLATQLLEYQALILNSLPGMDIYLFDKNYNYLFAAGKEKERFELNNIQFIGKSLFNVLEKKAVRLVYPCITKALQGIENEGEIRYEGEIYYMKGTPVKDFNNKTVGAILFSRNITNDKALEEQLKKSREEALKADRLKSIFIANLSHEIRTPLNAIIGFTEQLEKTDVSPGQEKLIRLINQASDQLLYLVTEIVFLFKVGMGKVYIEKSPFSISGLIAELSEIFKKQASEKNLSFVVDCDINIPGLLIGDSFRLRQILMNLLVNAIKYTDKGVITFNCKVKNETKEHVELVFEVKDTGTGISKNNLENIFNVFEQGNKLKASYRGGAGLGLGICKNLVELLGGQISVTSKVKMGSTFTVQLPFDKTSRLTHRPKKKVNYDLNANNKLLAGKKILLADDDEHNRLLAEIILKNWKTDYTLVEDGQKAIDQLNINKFDLAFIDIYMPNKNGLDVIKHVRSNNKGINFKTPVFCVTANVFKSDLNQYIKAGFDDYLLKPFREAELYNKLCNALAIEPEKNNNRLMKALKSGEIARKDNFNTDELMEAAKGSRSFFEKMVTNFISNAESLVAVFMEGVPAENWKEIGQKAHKSIPSFKYFGLTGIAGSLETLEKKTLRDIDYKGAASITKDITLQITEIIGQAKKTLEDKP